MTKLKSVLIINAETLTWGEADKFFARIASTEDNESLLLELYSELALLLEIAPFILCASAAFSHIFHLMQIYKFQLGTFALWGREERE
jgi:hypothetical protein